MTISAEEAEREVEASRGELDRTVEALKDKMTPGQLLDETMRTMGDTGGQIVSKFLAQAKENPMPLAVMGLGLAWLMTSNNRPRSSGAVVSERSFAGYGVDSAQYYDDGVDGGAGQGVTGKLRDAAGGVSDAMHGAADRAAGAAGAVRDRVSNTASGVVHGAQDAAARAKDMAQGATARAKDMAGAAADKATQYTQQAGQTVAGMVEREPLLIGGAGLLAGLAIGAALPATEAEKRYVAPMKDKVIDKTKAMAQDRLDDLNEAAQAAYHAVKDELENGAEDATPAERSEAIVHAAAQSLRDQASGPH